MITVHDHTAGATYRLTPLMWLALGKVPRNWGSRRRLHGVDSRTLKALFRRGLIEYRNTTISSPTGGGSPPRLGATFTHRHEVRLTTAGVNVLHGYGP